MTMINEHDTIIPMWDLCGLDVEEVSSAVTTSVVNSYSVQTYDVDKGIFEQIDFLNDYSLASGIDWENIFCWILIFIGAIIMTWVTYWWVY